MDYQVGMQNVKQEMEKLSEPAAPAILRPHPVDAMSLFLADPHAEKMTSSWRCRAWRR